MSLLLIITRLNLKLGNFKEAHQLLSMAKDKARKFESTTNTLLRKQDQAERAAGGKGQDQDESGPTAEQLNKMLEQSRKMKNLTDEVQGVFEDAKEDWQKKQLALAKKILTCHQAWSIASRFKVPKMTVSAACEALEIKIKPCQLGAF